MNRSQGLNRRHALKLLAGGGAGATALTKMAGGAGLAAILGAVPDPLEAAQVATRRGLPRLKITDIKVIRTQVGNTHMTNAKVLTSEAGLYGVGCGGHAERQAIVAETIEQFLKPAVVGRYADEIEDIWQMAWLAPYWRGSVDANNAMSAIDGALWDIMGKRAGMPVHNLLGGKVRPALPMFANVNGRDVKELEDNARARIAEGYKHLRVGAVGGDGSGAGGGARGGGPAAAGGARGGGPGAAGGITGGQGNRPGGGGLGSPGFGERGPIYRSRGQGSMYMNNLIASLEHVRKTIGFGVDLCAEVDFRLTPSEALVLARAVEPFRMFWVEEFFATEDVAWHKVLRAQSSTPVAWGEVAVSQTGVGAAGRQSLDRFHAHAHLGVRRPEHGEENCRHVRVLQRSHRVARSGQRVAGWSRGQHAHRFRGAEFRLRRRRAVLGSVAGAVSWLSRTQERHDILKRPARTRDRHRREDCGEIRANHARHGSRCALL